MPPTFKEIFTAASSLCALEHSGRKFQVENYFHLSLGVLPDCKSQTDLHGIQGDLFRFDQRIKQCPHD